MTKLGQLAGNDEYTIQRLMLNEWVTFPGDPFTTFLQATTTLSKIANEYPNAKFRIVKKTVVTELSVALEVG